MGGCVIGTCAASAVMGDVTRLEEEARFHRESTYVERYRAHKQLKAATRQVKDTAASEAAVAKKEVVVDRDREGISHAFAKANREHEALWARAAKLERRNTLLEERRGALAEAEAAEW